MKFKINITGEFDNIKGLRIAQKYHINIQCGACNTAYPNPIFVADEIWRTLKVKEVQGKVETFNVAVQCKNCENMMGIEILEPENQIEPIENLLVSPVINDACHISTIISDSAIVTSADGIMLDVVSNQDEVFTNCSFDNRTVAEDDQRGHTVDILKFLVEVQQVK